MSTESSAMSFLFSLNKAYALKATHCVLFHRATVCTHRNAASVLSPVRMFPEFVLCGAPAPGFPKFAKKLSCEQIKNNKVLSIPSNIMKYCHFRSCVTSRLEGSECQKNSSCHLPPAILFIYILVNPSSHSPIHLLA